ncbi:DNA-binding transcriptional regulator, AcrR family [Actinokineospora alba]|uniref:DNA-binding transcriptional regulator, AcrR family n=1 Tax=Actinokineospora alba TaxID=504798 RepID=A0A1H0R5H7_9PSEU|nr:TetR/AcrR family transcriptional regulator [Actinokineospora alba]TDP70238.1 TetR family transcriptional regulator [Actinokineospora alba]SDI36022.1 DNA-binding transcriptional regulator, AcrR family [Actinokineospora alba]SDP24782.1 DNA-binding transcriptional regulator, AcrR family [Actinokineospora alba]
MSSRAYHHGDLRRAVLDAAAAAITEHGPAGISLRDLARRAGVSHAAPGHHFGDKAGVLTALAAEGYDLLAEALREAQQSTGQFVELGVAYVRFAVGHRAHFEVMFRPDLYHADDSTVVAARGRSGDLLVGGVGSVTDPTGPDAEVAKVAAWSIVHGFATLWLTGALPAGFGDDPESAARAVAGMLFSQDPKE